MNITLVAELPYKVYTAMLSQDGTNNPTTIELENTIGPVVWTRIALGRYLATVSGGLPEGKVWFCIQNTSGTGRDVYLDLHDENSILLVTASISWEGSDFVDEDEILSSTPVEIRIYTP